MGEVGDKWNDGDTYEYFMGRWSSLMAFRFLGWLNLPANLNWLDIGCGTGALSEAIAQNGMPKKVSGVDLSKAYIEKVKERITTSSDFKVGSVDDLPFSDRSFDVVVSGLALNFFPDLDRALLEMKRVAKPNAVIAAYIWDYSDRMDFLRYFWDAACQLDPKAREYDEGLRFPICNTENLSREFNEAGFRSVEASFLDVETVFSNFEDYWNPFLGGQGPAPGYLLSMESESRDELKKRILERINFEADGSVKLIGRAIVVKAQK